MAARAARVLTGLLALICGNRALAQGGQLESVRDAVRQESRGGSTSSGGSWSFGDDDDDESWYGHALGEIVEFVLAWPLVLPRAVLNDSSFDAAPFRDYPEHGGPGLWAAASAEGASKAWSFRPRFESGSNFDHVERFGLGIQLEHASRFGFDGTWSRFREEFASGGHDELDLGDANFVFRFAESPRAAWRAGLGFNTLVDDAGSDFGFNLTYGADFLPAPNVTLGLEADFGSLGGATLLHGRVSAGFVLGRFELFGAWDGWDIDDANLSSLALGLRAWL